MKIVQFLISILTRSTSIIVSAKNTLQMLIKRYWIYPITVDQKPETFWATFKKNLFHKK